MDDIQLQALGREFVRLATVAEQLYVQVRAQTEQIEQLKKKLEEQAK